MRIKKVLMIIAILSVLLTLTIILFTKKEDEVIEESILTVSNEVNEEKKYYYVDIKGSVNNPGVYKFKENDRVIDAIEMAGGLTKDANTSNINLSQKLKSEMVIYIYNNKEIKENTINLTCDNVCKKEIIEVNNCIPVTTSKITGKVNINTATVEELMKVSGIGESKAKSIIEYRNNNGAFNNIEDIKNISGIGEAIFDRIKEEISV